MNMNFFTSGGRDEPKEWDPPENLRLLMLCARVEGEETKDGEDPEDIEKLELLEEGNTNKSDAVSVLVEESEVRERNIEAGKEGEREKKIMERYKLAGMVVNKKEDGRHESFSQFRFTLVGGDLFGFLDRVVGVLEMV